MARGSSGDSSTSESLVHIEATHRQKVDEVERHRQAQQDAHASAIAVMKDSYDASAKEEKRAVSKEEKREFALAATPTLVQKVQGTKGLSQLRDVVDIACTMAPNHLF